LTSSRSATSSRPFTGKPLTLNLKKEGDGISSVEEHPSIERARWRRARRHLGREVQIVANVVAVNPRNRSVTLKGPRGNTLGPIVEDPEQFANVKKGDQVESVYTEALAISVEPAAKK
jgi:hypothetical protein